MNRKIFCAMVLSLFAGMLAACSDVDTELKAPTYKTGISPDNITMSAFREQFPNQYETYMWNNRDKEMTVYKGSIPYHKNDMVNPLPRGYKYAQPYLKNLWLGYPFQYEYNETRGHTRALNDFINIDRINRYEKKGILPATCWNCKTPKMVNWIKEYGDEFWAKDVNTFRPVDQINQVENSIACATCHNPATMELQLYSVPLQDYLKSQGREWNTISRNEKRALVCAQCHVEYYFTVKGNGPTAKPVFPWEYGLDPENMYEYYKTHGPKDAAGKETPFYDFIHAVSKTPIIKMQHPDYEMWSNGPHGAAGVTCADCHMPYMIQNGKKFSSHWMTSPLKDPTMRACRQCHYDKTPEYLKARVIYVQEKTYNQLLKAQEASVRAHEAIRLASEWTGYKAPNYDELLAAAREANRKGQMFWDYVSAENGVGFHNPAKSLNTLMTSMECSNQAAQLAEQVTNYGISPALAGDIKKIVPPILTLSRKLQQNREFLDKDAWTKVLPTLPEHEQVWFGQYYSEDGVPPKEAAATEWNFKNE